MLLGTTYTESKRSRVKKMRRVAHVRLRIILYSRDFYSTQSSSSTKTLTNRTCNMTYKVPLDGTQTSRTMFVTSAISGVTACFSFPESRWSTEAFSHQSKLRMPEWHSIRFALFRKRNRVLITLISPGSWAPSLPSPSLSSSLSPTTPAF